MEPTSSYQLKQGDEDYIFNITLIESGVKLSCEDSKGQIYSKEYSLENIKSIDQIFSKAETNFDIVEVFDNILRNEKVRADEESGSIQILLFIASENRQIQILLSKEGAENIQEIKDIAYDQNQIMNQINENLNMNADNYNLEEANLENIGTVNEANVDTNTNLKINTNEFIQGDIQQNENTNTQTNIPEGFNVEEFLKGSSVTQTQIIGDFNTNVDTNINTNVNTNIDTNINTNNIQEENNYFQNTDEQANMNININTQETSQVQNTQSYQDININTINTTNQIESQTNQKEIEYGLPFITPADQEEQININTNVDTNINTNVNTNIEATQNVDYLNQFTTAAATTTTTTTTTETNLYQNTLENNLSKVSQYHKVAISLPKEKSKDEIRISKITDQQNDLKNQHAQFNSKIIELTNLINSYKSQISLLQSQRGSGELESLRAENQKIRQQLMELGNLRNQLAEAENLKNQLSELESLRQKAAEVDSIKSQLAEINSLKIKIAQLSGIKDKLNELNQLKAQLNNLNQLNAQSSLNQNTKIVETTKMTRSIIKGDILHNLNELEMITRKINNSNNKITLNLLYKATADSDSAEAFHQKCDKAESSLVLVETDKGKRFGGFTTQNWRGDGEEKMDPNAFVFSLDKMAIYDNIPEEEAIGCYPKFGPIFLGCQIRIFDNAFKNGGTTFEKGANYDTEEDFVLSGGEQKFGVKEIEVYEVIAE